MEINDQKIIDVLQNLVPFIHDGREGYEQAAKDSVNPQLGPLYRSLAGQRAEFAQELHQIIQNHGGASERAAPAPGQLYQQWQKARADFAHQNEITSVDASMLGEEWAQKAYAAALEQPDLPQPTRELLERQLNALEQARQTLQEIKNNL